MDISDKQKIVIKFGSWELPMTVNRSDEHLYRQAEKLIKDRFAFYTGNYKGLATERYMVMCMLDIAVRLAHSQEAGDQTPIVQELEPLISEIEKALGEN